ncbi:group II intron maturase-specific domain-containing protein [Arthrobacter sulfonylureivorans]|uniref:Reverse transcriptase domain-containing protein n=1 Tax=Arthrobacter sulfonylureivorans TaxID=2486855 RepID=A0ABY3W9W4_9MICC|nr:group II intron maturase-specific domain-containing protein [Arthrobacter sulfonylureivorans]UNK47144.1 hypothetical protein MNQ99_07330 [Arthrobacter sulfonylureivorans]
MLSNIIMLDDFHQLMWSRGHRFVRYADDIRVFVKSKRAAGRVLDQCTKILEQDLKLRVNREKSKVGPANVATLLGYAFFFTASGVKLRVAPKALKRVKTRIKQLTSRKWSISMGERIQLLNRYIRGWMGYFRLADTPKTLRGLDEWFRRRMRQIRWKEFPGDCRRSSRILNAESLTPGRMRNGERPCGPGCIHPTPDSP